MHVHLFSDDEFPDSLAEDEFKVMIAYGVTTIRLMIGTPEQLVLEPADDYVAAFTRNVQRAKVVTVRSVMGPIANTDGHQIVRASAKIADVAPRVIEAGGPVPVVDEREMVIGALSPQVVIDTLIGKDARV